MNRYCRQARTKPRRSNDPYRDSPKWRLFANRTLISPAVAVRKNSSHGFSSGAGLGSGWAPALGSGISDSSTRTSGSETGDSSVWGLTPLPLPATVLDSFGIKDPRDFRPHSKRMERKSGGAATREQACFCWSLLQMASMLFPPRIFTS
jgi:hypothetical protein